GGFSVWTAIVKGVTVATLSNFTGTDTSFGSLIDGRYSLKVTGSAVTSGGTPMASDFTFADSGTSSGNQLFRLFGDANGDRVVNGADLNFFITMLGATTNDPTFDFNGDGVINTADLNIFRANYGAGI